MKRLSRVISILACALMLFSITSCGTEGLILPPHQHKFTYTVYPSSCHQYGYIEYDCACKYVYQEPLTELSDHNWEHTYTIDRQPTYTTEGEQSYHCLNTGCDARRGITSIPKLTVDIDPTPLS